MPAIRVGHGLDLAASGVCEAAAQRQPEPGPLMRALRGSAPAAGLEDRLDVLGRYAGTVVTNAEADHRALALDRDRDPLLAVAAAVLDERAEDPLDHVELGPDAYARAGLGHLHRDPLLLGGRAAR